jgi:formylmethanofuran dehydrogenase subunit E
MKKGDIFAGDDFQKCVDFHGHICPGLAIGYRAAKEGLARLRETRASDEELVAIVGTDACSVDAIQVLTGCTFGKGNFFSKDYGKHVFILGGRKTGQGLRIALKPRTLEIDVRHRELIDRCRQGIATEQERKEFQELHLQKAREIMKKPLEDLFTIRPVPLSFPPKAQIEQSKNCARCGEPTMGSKLRKVARREICGECFESSET